MFDKYLSICYGDMNFSDIQINQTWITLLYSHMAKVYGFEELPNNYADMLLNCEIEV